jgi:hypothetical protein
MVLVKASKDSEAGVMPTQQLLTEMGQFNEELVKAGIMFAGEGLVPILNGRGRHLAAPFGLGARVAFTAEPWLN